MSLEEMEAYLLKRLDYVGKWESKSAEDLLRCMEVLAQVRQAIASERIADRLDDIAKDVSAIKMPGEPFVPDECPF